MFSDKNIPLIFLRLNQQVGVSGLYPMKTQVFCDAADCCRRNSYAKSFQALLDFAVPRFLLAEKLVHQLDRSRIISFWPFSVLATSIPHRIQVRSLCGLFVPINCAIIKRTCCPQLFILLVRLLQEFDDVRRRFWPKLSLVCVHAMLPECNNFVP